MGYENTFFTFSGILFAACILVFFILPRRLNNIDAELDAAAAAAAEDQENNSQ
jgi:hypothetical protein